MFPKVSGTMLVQPLPRADCMAWAWVIAVIKQFGNHKWLELGGNAYLSILVLIRIAGRVDEC